MPTESKLFSLGGLRQGRLYRQPKFMRTMDVFDIEQGTHPLGEDVQYSEGICQAAGSVLTCQMLRAVAPSLYLC